VSFETGQIVEEVLAEFANVMVSLPIHCAVLIPFFVEVELGHDFLGKVAVRGMGDVGSYRVQASSYTCRRE